VIVIVGIPAWRAAEPAGPAGRACEIALEAAGRGRRVELVGRAGDDQAGDALLLALSRDGIGHVALLRDPAQPTPVLAPTPPDAESPLDAADEGVNADQGPAASAPPRLEPADVSLGLQYLTAFDVLVLADDAPPAVRPVAVDAAAFAGARLVVLLPAGDADAAGLPDVATVLAAPDGPDDGAFGRLAGAYAAGLDTGLEPGAAFAAAVAEVGWETVAPPA